MEEIKVKVGEFIRTIHGEIRKISKIIPPEAMGNDETELYELDKKCLGYKYTDNKKLGEFSHTERAEIKKHSKNIIDLIEVGDIVEVFDVLHNDIIIVWHEEVLKALKEDIEIGIGIKSILTHEQYNSIKYEVE